MTPVVILIALGLIQNAYCQAIGIANGGCNNLAVNGLVPNGLAPNGFIPNGLGIGANGFGLAPGLGCGAPIGYGDVAVTGELPVGGTTTVGGQVPVIGYVTFEGTIPAGGLVSVDNNCRCNGGIF